MAKTSVIHIRTDRRLKSEFIFHCKKYNYIPSKRIRALIKMDIEGEIKK